MRDVGLSTGAAGNEPETESKRKLQCAGFPLNNSNVIPCEPEFVSE